MAAPRGAGARLQGLDADRLPIDRPAARRGPGRSHAGGHHHRDDRALAGRLDRSRVSFEPDGPEVPRHPRLDLPPREAPLWLADQPDGRGRAAPGPDQGRDRRALAGGGLGARASGRLGAGRGDLPDRRLHRDSGRASCSRCAGATSTSSAGWSASIGPTRAATAWTRRSQGGGERCRWQTRSLRP